MWFTVNEKILLASNSGEKEECRRGAERWKENKTEMERWIDR